MMLFLGNDLPVYAIEKADYKLYSNITKDIDKIMRCV